MIVRPFDDELALITQPDHARLAHRPWSAALVAHHAATVYDRCRAEVAAARPLTIRGEVAGRA